MTRDGGDCLGAMSTSCFGRTGSRTLTSANEADVLGPAPRAELLHVLSLPDLDRAERIVSSGGPPGDSHVRANDRVNADSVDAATKAVRPDAGYRLSADVWRPPAGLRSAHDAGRSLPATSRRRPDGLLRDLRALRCRPCERWQPAVPPLHL
jgi:hypothetical protein